MSDVTRRIGRAGWGSGVGGWLVVLAGTVAAICVHGATDAESGPGTTGGEQPLAQTARESQDGLVWSLAFSPDGSRWASATLTGAVWLSDQTSGQSHLLRRGPALSARTVAFSADGLVLAVAGGGPAVALWDVEAVAELDPLDVGGGEVTHVAFSHDGTRLAVGGRDGRVSLWDWHDRKRIAELAGHRAAVTAMSLSPDGSRLVTGDSTGELKVWDVSTGRERFALRPHGAGVKTAAAAFSADGRLLATAGSLARSVRLWDASGGQPRGVLPVPIMGVSALEFAPEGTVLALAQGDEVASLWAADRSEKLGTFDARSRALTAIAFADGGRALATGGLDGSVRHWDLVQSLGKKAHQEP